MSRWVWEAMRYILKGISLKHRLSGFYYLYLPPLWLWVAPCVGRNLSFQCMLGGLESWLLSHHPDLTFYDEKKNSEAKCFDHRTKKSKIQMEKALVKYRGQQAFVFYRMSIGWGEGTSPTFTGHMAKCRSGSMKPEPQCLPHLDTGDWRSSSEDTLCRGENTVHMWEECICVFAAPKWLAQCSPWWFMYLLPSF